MNMPKEGSIVTIWYADFVGVKKVTALFENGNFYSPKKKYIYTDVILWKYK